MGEYGQFPHDTRVYLFVFGALKYLTLVLQVRKYQGGTGIEKKDLGSIFFVKTISTGLTN